MSCWRESKLTSEPKSKPGGMLVARAPDCVTVPKAPDLSKPASSRAHCALTHAMLHEYAFGPEQRSGLRGKAFDGTRH